MSQKLKAMSKRQKMFAAICIIGLVSGVTWNWWGPYVFPWAFSSTTPSDGTTTTTTTSTFSVVVKDPLNPGVNIDYYGTWTVTMRAHDPGTPTTSTANWDTIAGVSTIDDITRAVVLAALETHDLIYITVSGSCPDTAKTYNDGHGPRTYGARDFPIVDGHNTCNMYVTPNAAASITIRNQVSGAIITTANITTATNFTVEQYLNNASAGAYDQAYVAYTTYTGTYVGVNLVLSFTNATGGVTCAMTSGNITCNNLSLTAGGDGVSNVMVFSTSYLGQAHVTSTFNWGPEAISAALAVIESPSTTGIVEKHGATNI